MGKSVPKPNPVIDAILLSIFAAELGVIGYTLSSEPMMLGLLFAFLVVVAVFIRITKALFEIGGGWMSRNLLKHLGDPLKKRVTMKKWKDQSWQFVFHTVFTIYEIIILRDETWWQDTTTLWNKGSTNGIYPEHKMSIKIFYVFQLSLYIYMTISCKFLEEIRKDYVVMMSHHIVTIGLISWSYAMGYIPVGIIVLILHDASDIPLDLLKMVNYVKLEGPRGLFLSEIMFVVLLTIWIYCRVYLFPTKLMNTTLIESRESCMPLEAAHDWSNWSPCTPYWVLFNCLLASLYCLHIWWTYLIIRILVGVLTKGVHESAKDDYEGTSDSDNEASKDD